MKAGFLKNSVWFIVILMIFAVPGCAEMKDRWNEINPGRTVRTDYPGRDDKIAVSPPVIEPGTVAGGQKLSFRTAYTLFPSDKVKEFDVIEVITLSGSNLVIELSRKTSRKPSGSHLLALEFSVPPDLPPGPYELISTIRADGQEKRQAAAFTLKR